MTYSKEQCNKLLNAFNDVLIDQIEKFDTGDANDYIKWCNRVDLAKILAGLDRFNCIELEHPYEMDRWELKGGAVYFKRMFIKYFEDHMLRLRNNDLKSVFRYMHDVYKTELKLNDGGKLWD